MSRGVKERLREVIRKEEKKLSEDRRLAHRRDHAAEEAFAPIRQAAEEIKEELRTVPSLEFTVNPTSVWITLFDRELSFSYDAESQSFVGEDRGYSWYDGETYAESYAWPTADECVDAMIRLSAAYARMARAIQAAGRTA
jgi:hypothetical protein